MNVPPGFELLRHLLTEHQVDHGGASMLLPCLHENLSSDIALLRAGARRCGGALYDLNADQSAWEGPPGPVSSDRLALIQGLLTQVPDVVPGRLVVEEHDDGTVVTRFSDKRTPNEPSLDLILRCAAVVASSAYDEHDLIIIATEVAGLDAHRKELLWRMLALDPADLAIRGARTTIVPILGTKVDPEFDYRRLPPVRFVARWDRVLRRSQRRRDDAIASIAQSTGPIVLFLGAGASSSAKIPLGNFYRDRALVELVGPHESGHAAAEAFFDYLYEHEHFMPGEHENRATFVDQLTLERVLREAFNRLGYRSRISSPLIQELVADCAEALQYVRPGRRALRELAARLPGQLVLMTVNFDQLIETDLGTPHEVYFKPEHFKSRLEDLLAYVSGDQSKHLPILKLHGSIQEVDSLIATIDKTSAGLHEDVRHALDEILRVSTQPVTWVWVGCSMRDRDMNLWLGGRGAEAFDEWWVDPFPGPALDDFVLKQRTPRWAQIDRTLEDRLIVDSADGFLTSLAAAVAEAHSAD